jgi:hypothetical protein
MSERGYVMIEEIADPAAPDTACPRAGRTGPPKIEVFDSSSTAL